MKRNGGFGMYSPGYVEKSMRKGNWYRVSAVIPKFGCAGKNDWCCCCGYTRSWTGLAKSGRAEVNPFGCTWAGAVSVAAASDEASGRVGY